MRVLVLRDRRPGHVSQAEGLALAAARLVSITTERMEVRPRRFARDRVRRLALRRWRGDPAGALRLLYGIDPASITAPDVIAGSGRPTLAAGILLRRHFGARLVFAGFVNGYDAADFDLMLVQSPRLAGEPKRALSPIPCLIDPDQLPAPRPLRSLADLAGAEFSLLLGGRARGYAYSDDDWRALARLVVETNSAYGVRWSVSTSRRTPIIATQLFAQLSQRGGIARFVDYRTAGSGSADALFAADAVLVTEDSRSMVAEAIASRRPVVAFRPDRVAHSLATEEIAAMAAHGEVQVLPIRTMTADHFARSVLDIRPSTRDPRDLIAAALAPAIGLALPPLVGAGSRHSTGFAT